ncbi:MAG: type II secretion system GspH family protein, partial [Candidatus Taylorbacteria bacterium]|nr:type II secretion system GspH family protein [Candidatus Taylorbacteria bacterium]
MRMLRKGFTLIELLVVLSIIALLSSIVLSAVTSARLKARDARRFQDLNQIKSSLNLYFDTYGYYPVFPTVPVCGAWNRSDALTNPSVPDTCWSELENVLSTWITPLPTDPSNNFVSASNPTPHVYVYQTVNDGAGY